MTPNNTTSHSNFAPYDENSSLGSSHATSNTPFIARLLIFCIFILIFRQTLLTRGRSLSDMAVVDSFAAIDIAVVGMIGCITILSGAFWRTWSSLRRTPAFWLVGYYLFCAFSSLWSTIPDLSLYRACEYLILLLAILTILDQYQEFASAERAFLWVALVTIIFQLGFVIRNFGFTLSLDAWHSGTYSVSAAMVICYCLGEYLAMSKTERFEAKKRSRRFLLIGIFAFCALVLSTNSSSIIATLAGCILIFLLLRWLWLTLAGFLVCLLLFLLGTGGETLRSIIFPGKSLENIETGTGRIFLWEFLWHKFLQRPFLGYGFALVGVVAEGMATHAHNSFLSTIIGTGLVGLLLFAIFAMGLWWAVIVEVRRRKPGIVGCAGALAAVFVNSIGTNLLGDRWTVHNIVFVWLLGLFLLHTRNNKSAICTLEVGAKDIKAL